ncbi:nuclear transport factor 2 family protein [Micromonospora sp. URMC 105]|uniref:nuclear transport factor 2 family protein n=1 Tax=Micromonospora sp. URMC 105 TaxID=3423413 RepID=UPI003F197922
MKNTDHNMLTARAQEYFRLVDAGDPALLDLFTDDATAYFPKFGLARGKAEIGQLAQTLGALGGRFEHDDLHFISSGSTVVVEGRERGVMPDGTRWPDGTISQGAFCNVFEFRDGLINRVAIYADPDFASQDTDRIRQLHRGSSAA